MIKKSLLWLLMLFCMIGLIGCGSSSTSTQETSTAAETDTAETAETAELQDNTRETTTSGAKAQTVSKKKKSKKKSKKKKSNNKSNKNSNKNSNSNSNKKSSNYQTEAAESKSDKYAEEEESEDIEVEEDGEYTSKDEVALYIHTYDHLPSNFITKKEARELGWEGGKLEPYAPGKSIGGDYFGNYEGTLPEKDGREYHECDIDTLGKKRGAKRIIYSNDGLIYYTDDHYETFTLLYGEE